MSEKSNGSSINATLAELLSYKGSDNLSIPLVSLLSMYSFYLEPNILEITLILSLLLLFAAADTISAVGL